MTTNKPEVRVFRPSAQAGCPAMRIVFPSDRVSQDNKYVRLSDYEALQSEREKLQAAVAGLSNPEAVLVNMLRGKIALPDARSWSKLFGEVLNDEGERLLEIARLRSECERLRKDAERYRFIRDAEELPMNLMRLEMIGDVMDSAIDAAMQEVSHDN